MQNIKKDPSITALKMETAATKRERDEEYDEIFGSAVVKRAHRSRAGARSGSDIPTVDLTDD
jgi:hypothetical protein